ncbi:MAG: hypothetical protein LUD76_08560 [Alistipes sp.]|nr:hypothetical protein [Alistipes sp.]
MDKIHWKPDRGRTVSFSGHRRIEPASQPTLFGGGWEFGAEDPAGTGGVEDARTATGGAGTERYGAAPGEFGAVFAGGKSGSVPGVAGARTATRGAGTERDGAATGEDRGYTRKESPAPYRERRVPGRQPEARGWKGMERRP